MCIVSALLMVSPNKEIMLKQSEKSYFDWRSVFAANSAPRDKTKQKIIIFFKRSVIGIKVDTIRNKLYHNKRQLCVIWVADYKLGFTRIIWAQLSFDIWYFEPDSYNRISRLNYW